MYAALRKILKNVSQRGSFVNQDYLRFDMAYDEEITDAVLIQIEQMTNEWIRQAIPVSTKVMSVDEAKSMGAVAEFGEKYSTDVRVVQMGDVTADLCGGTHVANTNMIQSFALASFESKGSGIYRFSGYTGERISKIKEECSVYLNEANKSIEKAKRLSSKEVHLPTPPVIKGSYQDVLHYRAYLKDVQSQAKEIEKAMQQEVATMALDNLSRFDQDITGNCLITITEDYPADVAKQLVDRLLERLGQGTVFVVNQINGQLLLLAKTTQGVHCGNLVKAAAQLAGGNGGGKPDFAQAGAKDSSKIEEIIRFVKGELQCVS
jgi:alanyl-tRNA synthetase